MDNSNIDRVHKKSKAKKSHQKAPQKRIKEQTYQSHMLVPPQDQSPQRSLSEQQKRYIKYKEFQDPLDNESSSEEQYQLDQQVHKIIQKSQISSSLAVQPEYNLQPQQIEEEFKQEEVQNTENKEDEYLFEQLTKKGSISQGQSYVDPEFQAFLLNSAIEFKEMLKGKQAADQKITIKNELASEKQTNLSMVNVPVVSSFQFQEKEDCEAQVHLNPSLYKPKNKEKSAPVFSEENYYKDLCEKNNMKYYYILDHDDKHLFIALEAEGNCPKMNRPRLPISFVYAISVKISSLFVKSKMEKENKGKEESNHYCYFSNKEFAFIGNKEKKCATLHSVGIHIDNNIITYENLENFPIIEIYSSIDDQSYPLFFKRIDPFLSDIIKIYADIIKSYVDGEKSNVPEQLIVASEQGGLKDSNKLNSFKVQDEVKIFLVTTIMNDKFLYSLDKWVAENTPTIEQNISENNPDDSDFEMNKRKTEDTVYHSSIKEAHSNNSYIKAGNSKLVPKEVTISFESIEDLKAVKLGPVNTVLQAHFFDKRVMIKVSFSIVKLEERYYLVSYGRLFDQNKELDTNIFGFESSINAMIIPK